MSVLENQIKFFNIFKETYRNNIGLIQGFPNWTNRINFTIDRDDLLIHIPPVLIRFGTEERIARSKRKAEADMIMNNKKYNYLEFVIKNSCIIYASTIQKQVKNFYKKGNAK